MSLTGKATPIATAQGGNRLIDRLPKRQRDGVIAQCDTVDLAFCSVLCETGKPFEYAYFPMTAVSR